MTGLQISDIRLVLGGAPILHGVSIDVRPGEIVGLIGPNGAGKTSLLRAALGLATLAAGSVTLDGEDLAALALKDRAKKLSYAAQGAPVHWPLAVERLVALGRVPHLDPWQSMGAGGQAAVDRAMDATDCGHLRGRCVTTLSGGERARALLARTLATGAPYLLVDEPVASLDPAHQLGIMTILKAEARAGGGVLVVLHDLGLAGRFCDRLILMNEGLIVAAGTPARILTDDNLATVFGVSAARWTMDGETYLAPRDIR